MTQHMDLKTSVRQLASGEMENIRKRFESGVESNSSKTNASPKKVSVSSAVSSLANQEAAIKRNENVSSGNNLKPVISPKRIPPKITSQNNGNDKKGAELNSVREQILQKSKQNPESQTPTAFNKMVQNFNTGNVPNTDRLKTVHSESDLAGEVQIRTVSRTTKGRPVSVAERTKLFENKDSTEITNHPSVTSIQPPSPVRMRPKPLITSTDTNSDNQKDTKQTPIARPRSRPPSSSNEFDMKIVKDTKPTPPVRPRSRPPSQGLDDSDNVNNYGTLWDSNQKLPNAPPPPLKPPRTGAHDNYMKLKVLRDKSSQEKHEDCTYETIPDGEKSPVYRRINKSDSDDADSSKRPLLPTRPPPPKDRPVTIAASPISKKSYSFSGKQKPEIPKRPSIENASPLYEELDLPKLKFDINKVKHWDLPKDNLPESSMKRSYSAECLSRDSLIDDPVYVDPIKVNFRDDSGYDVYVDPSGYAIPYRHKTLHATTSTPAEVRPISQAVKCKLGNLKKKIFHPEISKEKKEFDLAKNKRKLHSVKMKINIAFAIMRKGKKNEDDGSVSVDTGSIESDSLVDEKEIEKRKDYCTIVRKNTAKRRKDKKPTDTAVYPQLFDFALVVGLEPISEEGGYRPHVIYKFPEQRNIKITKEGYLMFGSCGIESNISIPQFCFPDAGEFDVKTASPAAPSESYSFVLTNFDGQHVYGYCKRLVPLDTPAGLPEVICIVSPVDAFSMYNDLLDEIEAKRQMSLTMAKELIVAAFGRPLPEPGKLVHVRTLDENWETGTIFLARPSDDRVDNVNRETLLSKLSVDKIIKLFSVMLLERSILFCAKNLGILSQTIHAMRSLLYPFSWPHTYIPVLPDTMLDICCSPTPYIIGILSSHLQKVLNLPLSQIFIFDLDKRQIVRSQGDEDTLLPKSVQKALRTVLNMCKAEGDLKNAQNLLISEAFLRFFVEAIGHYPDYVVTQQNGQNVLEKENFVKNAQSSSMEQFLEWFTETQMFDVFLTDKVESVNKSNTLNIFKSRIKEYSEDLEEAKKDKKKSKGFLKLLK